MFYRNQKEVRKSMKQYIKDFVLRGLTSSSLGPIILVILYLILQKHNNLEVLTVNQVCISIISITLLAFIAGGINTIYQIEQLPLMVAITIHGITLYFSYLITYLLNNWIERGFEPIFIFSCIFILGYILIWFIIYYVTKQRTAKVNAILKKKQHLP